MLEFDAKSMLGISCCDWAGEGQYQRESRSAPIARVVVWKGIFSPASFSIILLFENLTYPASHSLELEMCFPEQ